jgi:hypothetical protein
MRMTDGERAALFAARSTDCLYFSGENLMKAKGFILVAATALLLAATPVQSVRADNGHHHCGGNSGKGVGNECLTRAERHAAKVKRKEEARAAAIQRRAEKRAARKEKRRLHHEEAQQRHEEHELRK